MKIFEQTFNHLEHMIIVNKNMLEFAAHYALFCNTDNVTHIDNASQQPRRTRSLIYSYLI